MTRFLLWLSVGLLLLCAVPGFGVWSAGSAARVFEPTLTPVHFVWLPMLFRDASAVPTPFPTATVSPTPQETPTASPSPSLTPEETPTATVTVSPTPQETPTASPSPSLTPEETPTATVTVSLTPQETSTATPTRTPTVSSTPTSTATPTPTVTPSCSVTNVTGTYYATLTNMVGYGCPISPVPPAPGDIGVIQTGTALLFRTSIGDGTGAINTTTGQFTVVGALPSAGGCPIFSTCTNTTSGTFTIGQSPMTFTGTGRIDITGLVRCYVTYDMFGDRTSCTAP